MNRLYTLTNFNRNYKSYSVNNSVNSENSLVSEIIDKNKNIQKQKINKLVDENNLVQDINLSRKLEFDRGMPLSFGFVDNKIFTIPFSFKGYISFICNKLLKTPFNICIILVCLYYLFSFLFDMDNLGYLNLFFSISFHLFIFIIEILFATIDYISIYLMIIK